MIIFGSRSVSKLLATLTLLCGNCHNPAANHVVQRSTWFTLFFLPIFPVRFRRFLTCTFCGSTATLTKQQANELVASVQQPDAQPGYPGGQHPNQY